MSKILPVFSIFGIFMVVSAFCSQSYGAEAASEKEYFEHPSDTNPRAQEFNMGLGGPCLVDGESRIVDETHWICGAGPDGKLNWFVPFF